jgi:amino acid adenylation domain-containing protein
MNRVDPAPLSLLRGPRAAYPLDTCLDRLVEAQVLRTPDAIAVTFGDVHIDYVELDERANRLARHLRSLGVGTETLVGICLDRSPDMVIALFAVLKAGGAYVPLDPASPPDRLGYLLDDARAPVLVTNETIARTLPPTRATLVRVDADAERIARADARRVESGTSPQNLAYVIYTSGSTGRPKGVCISHASLVNHLYWVNDVLLGDRVRLVPWVSSVLFGAHVKQAWAPLLRGERVWIFSRETVLDPKALLGEIGARDGVGLNCVTTLWRVLLEAIEGGRAPNPGASLTQLMVGGEALTRDLVTRTLAVFPGLPIWNMYGSTETTPQSSAGPVAADGEITLGRPISNAEVYVLDARFEPAPPGAVGELCVGGAGLARGYLGRPDLTAERFVPNDFGAPGSRLYRTGDMACLGADSTLEYLGRIDHQVKIRGVRVELGEVETALRAHPAIRDAVAAPRAFGPGDTRLVAYVVAREPVGVDALRDFVRERLPSELEPAAFVLLDVLPMLPNGKVDREALPMPTSRRPDLDEPFVAPTTELDRFLAALWQETLGIDAVGLHDDFFRLGGSSLQGMVLINRLQAGLGEFVHIVALFEAPTVSGLAAHLVRNHPAAIARRFGDLADLADLESAAAPATAARPPAFEPAALTPERARELLARIDQLSETEVDILLGLLAEE